MPRITCKADVPHEKDIMIVEPYCNGLWLMITEYNANDPVEFILTKDEANSLIDQLVEWRDTPKEPPSEEE